FGIVGDEFLHDCEPDVIASYKETIADLKALGLQAAALDAAWWADSSDIFAPIQAWEAAGLHAGRFDKFETAIRERLEWGSRISPNEIASLRERHAAFQARMEELFAAHELILLPAAPVAWLAAGANHTNTRKRLLRYTTPFSLAGVPAVTIPCRAGGMQ